MFTRPARPHHPADLHKSSQPISLRLTMFRAACDNSVTTSQPASPPTANLRISKCPPASPVCAKPVRANPLHCPTTARQRLIANRHDSPSRPPHAPTLAGPAVSLHSAHSRLSDVPAAHIQSRVRGMARRHAHETSPCQPTTATKTESSSSFAPDSPLPGSPAID